MDVPSLKAFRARLDVALGSLVWWLMTVHIAGGLKLDERCSPFQPRPFCDSHAVHVTVASSPELKRKNISIDLNCLCRRSAT